MVHSEESIAADPHSTNGVNNIFAILFNPSTNGQTLRLFLKQSWKRALRKRTFSKRQLAQITATLRNKIRANLAINREEIMRCEMRALLNKQRHLFWSWLSLHRCLQRADLGPASLVRELTLYLCTLMPRKQVHLHSVCEYYHVVASN